MFNTPLLRAAVVILLGFTLSTGYLSAEKQDQPVQAKTDTIEVIENVAVADATDKPSSGLVELSGRFHPVFIHFPIAWLILLLLIDTGALFFGQSGWLKCGLIISVLALASFFPAIVSGFILADSESRTPQFLSLVLPHRDMNVAAGVIFLAAFIVRWKRKDSLEKFSKWAYYLMLLASTALILSAARLGGKMVYGENFLPF